METNQKVFHKSKKKPPKKSFFKCIFEWIIKAIDSVLKKKIGEGIVLAFVALLTYIFFNPNPDPTLTLFLKLQLHILQRL